MLKQSISGMSGRRRNRKKKANAVSVTVVGKGSDNITGDQELIASAAVEKIQIFDEASHSNNDDLEKGDMSFAGGSSQCCC
ncbi:unnamed protein product [Lactuca virosa]|uniref:Uncharacterized protein n=1 Tax=Lactuca virosa TaxID=75947 RepID=A0AAU9NW91_9ASTR|nr:unnamed protein product [Lactuca virosa]